MKKFCCEKLKELYQYQNIVTCFNSMLDNEEVLYCCYCGARLDKNTTEGVRTQE